MGGYAERVLRSRSPLDDGERHEHSYGFSLFLRDSYDGFCQSFWFSRRGIIQDEINVCIIAIVNCEGLFTQRSQFPLFIGHSQAAETTALHALCTIRAPIDMVAHYEALRGLIYC